MSEEQAASKIGAGLKGAHVRRELRQGKADKYADADRAEKVSRRKTGFLQKASDTAHATAEIASGTADVVKRRLSAVGLGVGKAAVDTLHAMGHEASGIAHVMSEKAHHASELLHKHHVVRMGQSVKHEGKGKSAPPTLVDPSVHRWRQALGCVAANTDWSDGVGQLV